MKGHHNIKAGAVYEQTFLREHDSLGIVDSTYPLSAPCVDNNGNPLPGYASQSDCDGVTSFPNGNYLSVLAPYDLTRGGSDYLFFGHTDVKELALYIEDEIKAGNWDFNLGIRGDIYNGLATTKQPEPRVGIAYNIKPSATVLRVSYARTLETPFNENLVLSSTGCSDAVLNPILGCTAGVSGNLYPGFRNEFHAGFQQAVGKNVVVSGEYLWKYTHNGFDFAILGNTPIFFPVDWHNSKIPGYALDAEIPNYHHFSAYLVTSSVAARFFPPQVAGAGPPWAKPAFPSASTTTKSSTKPRTSSTPSPAMAVGTTASGAALTGASTQASSPGPHPATASPIPILPAETVQPLCLAEFPVSLWSTPTSLPARPRTVCPFP